jgi:predicted transcriptional regulator
VEVEDMAKTITVRLDDTTYRKIKGAADSERRTISNFIEYATLAYVESSGFVTDEEMNGIVQDDELMANLKQSIEEIERGQYRIVD